MRRKNVMIVLFAVALMLLLPALTAEAKTKPKLAAEKKTMTAGQAYRLELKGVSSKADVKWKTNKKSVVFISKKKGNTVTFKAKKKGSAVVTAVYKKKQYKCRIAVREKKTFATDNPALSSKNVTLHYLSETYKNHIKHDHSHIREYHFRVSGTKKKVKEWKMTGKGADYFRITDYGLLQMDWEPSYIEPCVTAKVTAILDLEDGRKLTATVKGYSELNIYMDTVFINFEKQYITSSMTEKEKQKRQHGISVQPLIMTYTTVTGLTFFSKEKETVMQAAMLCGICAAIWESKPLPARIMMRMGRHWFLRTADFIW